MPCQKVIVTRLPESLLVLELDLLLLLLPQAVKTATRTTVNIASNAFTQVCFFILVDYPFNPALEIPAIMYFCKKIYKTTIGMMTNVEAAIRS